MTSKRDSSRVWVLVGMCGSGKSSLAAHLKSRRLPVIRFGQITIDELERRGLPISETNERQVRERLRAERGMDAYAQLCWPRIEKTLLEGDVVVDGLYSWSEYAFLKKQLGDRMVVLAVFTPRAIRYARLVQRPERPLTVEQAEQRDVAEIEQLEKGGPVAMADYTLFNDGSLADLTAAADRLFDTFSVQRNW